jgi:predicted Zn-dependent protease
MAAAMLAVVHYKKKDHAEMKRVLEVVTKRAKSQGLAWTLRAYLLCQIGERAAAQQVLAEGVKKTKDDPKVKEALLAVQNDRKIKMRAYKEQWYQFHLERPPAEYQQVMIGGKGSKASLRGRW